MAGPLITKQSNAGKYIDQAAKYNRVVRVELSALNLSIGPIPVDAARHLIKAIEAASYAEAYLNKTGVPDLQLPLLNEWCEPVREL
jgi:hypothetical protein